MIVNECKICGEICNNFRSMKFHSKMHKREQEVIKTQQQQIHMKNRTIKNHDNCNERQDHPWKFCPQCGF